MQSRTSSPASQSFVTAMLHGFSAAQNPAQSKRESTP